MKQKAVRLIGLCSLCLLLAACGSWYRISEIKTVDNFSSEFVSIPIRADYGIYTLGTSFVSFSDRAALAEEIESWSNAKVQYQAIPYSQGSLLVCVLKQNRPASMLQIVSQSPTELDAPYSYYPYAYWFTNLEADIGNKAEIPFPFYMTEDGMEDSGWLCPGKQYHTDFSMSDFEDFYNDYCACYGLDADCVAVDANRIILTQDLLYGCDDASKAVTLSFDQDHVVVGVTELPDIDGGDSSAGLE